MKNQKNILTTPAKLELSHKSIINHTQPNNHWTKMTENIKLSSSQACRDPSASRIKSLKKIIKQDYTNKNDANPKFQPKP